MSKPYQLFAWNYSYFSAKVRAYMSYKRFKSGLAYEEILATQEIINDLLIPATDSNVVPQVRTPDGNWLQDSSEIIDELEKIFPASPVIPATPKQKLVCYIIELLADEWMLPWGFWERWHYSLASTQPNHEAFNALQWGRIYHPNGSGQQRMDAARFVFKERMSIAAPDEAEMGPFAGLVQLGVTSDTIDAWTTSMRHMLGILEAHFDQHPYLLGGAPSLADLALMGPLYPHLYKDPVSGYMMRTEFPLISEWVERTNGSEEAGYRSYRETQYALEAGELVPLAEGSWLADDEVPETLLPLIDVFFKEMWPVLKSTMSAVSQFIASDHCAEGDELPGKSFYAPRNFKKLQSNDGPLTVPFELHGVSGYRMASPYHIWMLQRIAESVFAPSASTMEKEKIGNLLQQFESGTDLLSLNDLLAHCRVEKRFEKLYVGAQP